MLWVSAESMVGYRFVLVGHASLAHEPATVYSVSLPERTHSSIGCSVHKYEPSRKLISNSRRDCQFSRHNASLHFRTRYHNRFLATRSAPQDTQRYPHVNNEPLRPQFVRRRTSNNAAREYPKAGSGEEIRRIASSRTRERKIAVDRHISAVLPYTGMWLAPRRNSINYVLIFFPQGAVTDLFGRTP